MLTQVEEVPTVRLQALVELGVDCLDFAFGAALREGWSDEKLREPVESLLERDVAAVEVVVRVSETCIGVVHATIVLDELRILVL